MKTRVRRLAAALAAVLLLAGCSLARPEVNPGSGDKFIGVYAFCTTNRGLEFYDNPHLTEYSSSRVSTEGYGAFALPRQVLFAEEDGDGGYTFPGMEGGYTLFAAKRTLPDGDPYYSMISNMAAGENGNAFHVTIGDAGKTTIHSLSGTVFYGPPMGAGADWDSHDTLWTGYRVYQTEDGRVYLDGGNSFGGGGSFGFSLDDEQAVTANGSASTERVEVSVSVRETPRLERLAVTQFGSDNTVLQTVNLPPEDDLPTVKWAAGAAWALVEETSAAGVKRTAYSVPSADEAPVSHQVILLDRDGLGRVAALEITAD